MSEFRPTVWRCQVRAWLSFCTKEWSGAYGCMVPTESKKCHSANLLGLYSELSSGVALKCNSEKKGSVAETPWWNRLFVCLVFANLRHSITSKNISELFSESLSSWKELRNHCCWCGLSQGAPNLPFGCPGFLWMKGVYHNKNMLREGFSRLQNYFALKNLESPCCTTTKEPLERWDGRGGMRTIPVSAVPRRMTHELWPAGGWCAHCYPKQCAFPTSLALGVRGASPFLCCEKSD